MKYIKKLLLFSAVCICFILIFRASIFRGFVVYKSIGQRAIYNPVNHKLIKTVDENISSSLNYKIEDVIEISLKITSEQLEFSKSSKIIDPNRLINSKRTHCVGYSGMFATICNYILVKYNLDKNWTVSHRIGQIYLQEKNIHSYFSSPFFKNHDFVTIENKKNRETYAVDPSLHDYLWIDYITFDQESTVP